jgi:hypothetical protein
MILNVKGIDGGLYTSSAAALSSNFVIVRFLLLSWTFAFVVIV